MKKWCILLVLSAGILAGFKTNKLTFVVPKGWPKPVYDFNRNPLAEGKIQLGRLLFYDPLLSKDSTISCASCHSSFNAFTHVDHSLSHGISGKIGTRNSPALMNLAWQKDFMWDGSINHLDVQALAPISNPLEMDESLVHVVAKLKASAQYKSMFYNAWGDSNITGERVLKSLSQFMLTLVSCNSRYDSVMRGEKKFTTEEANGYTLYKKNCAGCHAEPLFTNGQYENNGLYVDDSLHDIGRMKVTKNRADSLKFKVPTLRNLKYSYPYMHDGRFKNMGQVINNYMLGLQHTPTLSPKLQKGVYFTDEEKVDLMAFLFTLNDKSFITNPDLAFPRK
ncbi:MAG: c-type cytochrome [Bacteroidetes bacterium]|nr:c-type cytochrome [Bacteroidota bacterium]